MSRVEQINRELQTNTSLIERADALARLQANPDYQKIFDEYLLGSKIHDNVALLGESSHRTDPTRRAMLHDQLEAAGILRQQLFIIARMGRDARDAQPHLEKELSTAYSEE